MFAFEHPLRVRASFFFACSPPKISLLSDPCELAPSYQPPRVYSSNLLYTSLSDNCCCITPVGLSGLQKGPAERGHVKNRQKVSKSFSTLFDIFRAGQKTSKIVKKNKMFFDTFRQFSRGTFFRPLLGGSDGPSNKCQPCRRVGSNAVGNALHGSLAV